MKRAVTMWLAALVFAMVESAIFPEQAACTRTRTLLWLGAANLCFVGGALLFGFATALQMRLQALGINIHVFGYNFDNIILYLFHDFGGAAGSVYCPEGGGSDGQRNPVSAVFHGAGSVCASGGLASGSGDGPAGS